LTDTSVKNALTPSTAKDLEQMSEELGLTNKKQKHATYLKRDSQKHNAKIAPLSKK
jgi:hypothetical protein